MKPPTRWISAESQGRDCQSCCTSEKLRKVKQRISQEGARRGQAALSPMCAVATHCDPQHNLRHPLAPLGFVDKGRKPEAWGATGATTNNTGSIRGSQTDLPRGAGDVAWVQSLHPLQLPGSSCRVAQRPPCEHLSWELRDLFGSCRDAGQLHLGLQNQSAPKPGHRAAVSASRR